MRDTIRRLATPRPHECLASPAALSRHLTAHAVLAAVLVVVLSVVLILSGGGVR